MSSRSDTLTARGRRSLGIAAAVLWVVASGSQTLLAGAWRELGPNPILSGPYTGRCSAIVASPTDPNKYWVGGASGGVWRTTDGGLTWTPLTDDMPTNQIGALAIDPADENTIYAGTGEANFANHCLYGLGLYKSSNGGDSWTVLGAEVFSGRTFSRVVVSHEDRTVLYASIMHAGGFPARAAAKGHPQKDGPVGVFRSTDGGATWTHLLNGLPDTAASDVWMDPSDADVLYAAIGDIFAPPENGIFKSIDGGDSWVKLGGGLPTTGVGRITLAIAPSDPQRIYTIITNPTDPFGGGASTKGVYRSADGGTTWAFTNAGNFQATYGWFLSTAIVHPTDPNTLFVGGLSLLRTQDGGQSYSGVTPQHVDMHGLAWDASGRLLSANDGGLHRSANLGSSWQALNNSLGTIQFYPGLSVHPDKDQFLLGGTQDNGTNRREDNGTWTQRLGGDGGYTALTMGIIILMYAESQGTGNLYMSTNGGDSFNSRRTGINSSDRNCFLPPVLFDPTDWHNLYYATHRIYRSTNNGQSWVPISGDLTGGSPAAIRALMISPANVATLYCATNDGRFLSSRDGGVNWSLKRTDLSNFPRVTRQIAVDPEDDATAYLGYWRFGADRVRKTTDYGDTWTVLDGNLPDVPVNTIAVHRDGDRRAVFAGTDRDVYVSYDDQPWWSRYGRNQPNSPVLDLIVDPAYDRIVAGTLGRGAWSLDLPTLTDPDEDGDFDLGDYVLFVQGCFSGPYDAPGFEDPGLTCRSRVDYDLDGDVDLDDVRNFTIALDGPQQ
jgi:photosystem II stability/assembly factor-like uncharacterized protein